MLLIYIKKTSLDWPSSLIHSLQIYYTGLIGPRFHTPWPWVAKQVLTYIYIYYFFLEYYYYFPFYFNHFNLLNIFPTFWNKSFMLLSLHCLSLLLQIIFSQGDKNVIFSKHLTTKEFRIKLPLKTWCMVRRQKRTQHEDRLFHGRALLLYESNDIHSNT